MANMPPEVPVSELPGELLRARVARARVYLLRYRNTQPGPGSAEDEAALRDHLAYLNRLGEGGRLYGYGPIEPSPGDAARELAIVVAASEEEARRIAEGDPWRRSGLREVDVQAHTINEGVACYVARAMAQRAGSLAPFDPDGADSHLGLEALQARAAGAQLQLIDLAPTEKPRPAEDTATMDAHFVWLRENEMAARLMSCGPVQPAQPPAPGVWGGGLGVAATSRERAERMAADEPSGIAGYRVLSVRGWTMQYGVAAPIAMALQSLNRLGD